MVSIRMHFFPADSSQRTPPQTPPALNSTPMRGGGRSSGSPTGVAAVTYRSGIITLNYVLKTPDKLRDSRTVVAAH